MSNQRHISVCIVQMKVFALILSFQVIAMIDVVFWNQVKAAWSQACDVKFVDREKVKRDAPPEDLIDDMMNFSI